MIKEYIVLVIGMNYLSQLLTILNHNECQGMNYLSQLLTILNHNECHHHAKVCLKSRATVFK